MANSKTLSISLIVALVSLPAASLADVAPSETSAVVVSQANVNRAVGSLDRITGVLMRKTGVPGVAIAVVCNDKVAFLRGYGVRKTGTKQRVDANTVFEIASLSKLVGAALFVLLSAFGSNLAPLFGSHVGPAMSVIEGVSDVIYAGLALGLIVQMRRRFPEDLAIPAPVE